MSSLRRRLLVWSGTGLALGLAAATVLTGLRARESAGELLDSTDWADGENPADQSWGRFPDKTGSFSTRVVTSPGSANP